MGKGRTDARWLTPLAVLVFALAALGANLRIVTYNTAADIGGVTQVPPDFITVLHNIEFESTYAPARPIDVLALQETTSNTTTVDPIVTSLNGIYGAGAYARSTYQGTQQGGTGTGNGPNAMVYRTSTLQLVQQLNGFNAIGVPGTPSALSQDGLHGVPRQAVRYQFRPVGGLPAHDFYVYVSHYKASTGGDNESRRNDEAMAIRADAATLAATARIIYTGDFNMYSSNEAAYQTLISASPSPGQGFDSLIPAAMLPADWSDNPTWKSTMSYSATDLHVRFDFQLVTNNVLTDANGLKMVSGSCHTFGSNGSSYQTTVTSGSNTALPASGFPAAMRSATLSALASASDHLPVVADYTINLTPPNGDFDHDNDTDMSDFAHLQSCMTASAPSAPCTDADMNGDAVINNLDVDLFTNCMAGADIPPGC